MVYDLRRSIQRCPRLCLPIAMADPNDPVVALAWAPGGLLVSAHESGAVALRRVGPAELAAAVEWAGSDGEGEGEGGK